MSQIEAVVNYDDVDLEGLNIYKEHGWWFARLRNRCGCNMERPEWAIEDLKEELRCLPEGFYHEENNS
jgi:hypothetical protein